MCLVMCELCVVCMNWLMYYSLRNIICVLLFGSVIFIGLK